MAQTRGLEVDKSSTTLKEKDLNGIIIHQTHDEKSDWSRAFNQFTIACEPDMMTAISAADVQRLPGY